MCRQIYHYPLIHFVNVVRPFALYRDVIVKLPLGLKILRNQFHAPQSHVVVGWSGGIPPIIFFVS